MSLRDHQHATQTSKRHPRSQCPFHEAQNRGNTAFRYTQGTRDARRPGSVRRDRRCRAQRRPYSRIENRESRYSIGNRESGVSAVDKRQDAGRIYDLNHGARPTRQSERRPTYRVRKAYTEVRAERHRAEVPDSTRRGPSRHRCVDVSSMCTPSTEGNPTYHLPS